MKNVLILHQSPLSPTLSHVHQTFHQTPFPTNDIFLVSLQEEKDVQVWAFHDRG
jgi:hypothetical protein